MFEDGIEGANRNKQDAIVRGVRFVKHADHGPDFRMHIVKIARSRKPVCCLEGFADGKPKVFGNFRADYGFKFSGLESTTIGERITFPGAYFRNFIVGKWLAVVVKPEELRGGADDAMTLVAVSDGVWDGPLDKSAVGIFFPIL